MKNPQYLWIIPVCLVIIGWFGIFWTMNLADIDVNINMDDNTLEAIKSLNGTFPENIGYFYYYNSTTSFNEH